ncbi:hypothetical protein KSP40_PGU008541 [Platanthera guangdongensis]|uniref:Uncharacterized protein n=1 Tax=Platanthera guangdongensis TaxID=2320717 RepID=A0ABR2LHF3_9ASPA
MHLFLIVFHCIESPQFNMNFLLFFQIDPEEERRILAKEKAASAEYLNNTLKRDTLILKKRDLTRRKMQEMEKKKNIINQLLAAEGLELLDTDEDVDSLL